MAADHIYAKVLVFPDIISGEHIVDIDSPISEATDTNRSIALSVSKPDIVTLYHAGVNRGASIRGTLHFPDIFNTSSCRNITQLPETKIYDDLVRGPYAAYHVIAFAPWVPSCNKEFLDRARDDRSDVKGFLFYSLDHNGRIPSANDAYWSGIKQRDYPFPIYGMRGLEGAQLMDTYTDYAQNRIMLTDKFGNTGRARVLVTVSTGKASTIPGLWLFLLIVLGVLVFIIAFTSLSMHLLQFRRLRSLRRRVASGEVDLEVLGIKRLLVPRKILDKIPLCAYVSSGSPAPTSPLPSIARTYSQVSCPICLEDFVSGATTVRELPCKHIYHPVCIDSFLEEQSSLCPLCKASVLPPGYVPESITHNVVRRERIMRRRRWREEVAPTRSQLMWRRFVAWWDGGEEARMVVRHGVELRERGNLPATADGTTATNGTPAANGTTTTNGTPAANGTSAANRTTAISSSREDPPLEEERGGKFFKALRAVFPGY